MFHFLLAYAPLFDVIARGGGGGSGGGGGGSGGAGSVIALIGYVPAYYTTSTAHKFLPKAPSIVLGSAVGFFVTMLLLALAGGWLGFGVGIGAAIGVFAGVTNLHARVRNRARVSKQKLQFAASSDPAWQETTLKNRIQEVFMNFQQDWSSFNLQRMQTYMSPRYYTHVQLMMKALYQMSRQNNVANPRLIQSDVVEIADVGDNSQDTFTAYIKGQANDQLLELPDQKVIYTDNQAFEEFWQFSRSGDSWVLDKIDQATADVLSQNTSLKAFADRYQMCYSLDWGWLLLPKRGRLFGKANFKNSDVNNHVIGEWEGLLVQLYTYIPQKANAAAQNHLIAQINLPKSYGGIIIERKGGWSLFKRTPKGYQSISFEWPDFNKRYQVYATDMDKVTSFELLNPAFMAELYDRDLKVNIEVVDNIVYLYAIANNVGTKYESMMTVLQRAFRELKR